MSAEGGFRAFCGLNSKIAVERLESGLRPLSSREKWICRFHQAGEKRSRSSTRASLSRLASASRLGGEERRPHLIAHAFRRNGVTVPAQRHRRSGATASPFRRNGIAVPAQRHHRSGATASPFRRNGVTVPAQPRPRSGAFGPPSGAFPAGETGRIDRGAPIFRRYLPVLRQISV